MNYIDQHVGARLRTRREALYMTEGDIAARLNLTIADISRTEVGARRASAEELQTLCQLLQITPSDIYEGLQPSEHALAAEPLEPA